MSKRRFNMRQKVPTRKCLHCGGSPKKICGALRRLNVFQTFLLHSFFMLSQYFEYKKIFYGKSIFRADYGAKNGCLALLIWCAIFMQAWVWRLWCPYENLYHLTRIGRIVLLSKVRIWRRKTTQIYSRMTISCTKQIYTCTQGSKSARREFDSD